MRNLLVAVLLTTFTIMFAEHYASACSYVLQLQTDPAALSQYNTTVSNLNWLPSDPSDTNMDEVSGSCLACHDGVSAPPADRIHSIGMNYESISNNSPAYKKRHQLPANMVFIRSKVGCISCHDALNPVGMHLAVDNAGSALCLACHNK